MDRLQGIVLRSLLGKEAWAAFRDIVNEGTFGGAGARGIYSMLQRLHSETAKDLTITDLYLDAESRFKGDRRTELEEIITAISQAEEVDLHALRRYVQRFAAREYLAQAAHYIAHHLDDDEIPVKHVADLVARAVDADVAVDAAVLELDEAALPGEADDRTALVGLGLSAELDRILGGGVAAGELALYLAPPARGKTSYLIKSGAAAAQAGRNVLHVTLEISANRVVRRYDQAITGLTKNELITMPHVVLEARHALPGKVYVKDWSYQGTHVDDIYALVTRMRQQGKDVDFVIVDYLELLKPNAPKREMRFNYGQLAQDIRSMAVALQVPLVTAWQVNREGSDRHYLSERDVSECWDIIKHADTILGLNQTDAEREQYQMRINVIKQRDSTARSAVYLRSNLERMIITDLADQDVEDHEADPEAEI